MPRGGTRPGAGRKPGSLNKATLAREAGAATLTDLAREYTEWAIGNLRDIAGDTKQSGRRVWRRRMRYLTGVEPPAPAETVGIDD